MALEDYTVKIVKRRNISQGQKIKLALIEDETGEVVREQWKGLTNRQLNNLDERLRNWGERIVEDIESDTPDVESKEISL